MGTPASCSSRSIFWGCILSLLCLDLTFFFKQLKLCCVYFRIEPKRKLIVDNESHVTRCWRKKLQISLRGRLE